MSPTPVHRRGSAPTHVVQVWGGDAAWGARVRSLATGLVARGLRVTVCAPPGSETAVPEGAHYVPLPHRGTPDLVVLRSVCADADLVHAHGARGAVLSSLALPTGVRPGRRTPLVVSWDGSAVPERFSGSLLRGLERWALRRAAVVLAATPAEVQRARRHGARDARLALDPMAPTTVPSMDCAARRNRAAADPGQPTEGERSRGARAALGTGGRPLLLAVGRLAPGQGYGTLLTASRAWRRLSPRPLLAIAGDGPARAALQRRIRGEALPVRLLGRRDDVPDLLTAADAAVVSARRGDRSPLAGQALRAGVPLVVTAAGETRELLGGAALLVPYGDARALAEAVGGLLGDPRRGAELAAAGRERAARWPSEEQAVAHVLSVYDELRTPVRRLPGRPRSARLA